MLCVQHERIICKKMTHCKQFGKMPKKVNHAKGSGVKYMCQEGLGTVSI